MHPLRTHGRRMPHVFHGLAILLATQLATACGLVDSDGADAHGSDGDSDGAGGSDVLGTGGSTSPWGPYDVIVEGCESPTYQATSFCYADCPRYDALRARCDALCTSVPAFDCPPMVVPSTGGSAPVLDPCDATGEPTSLGGAGGEGSTCLGE